MKLVGLTGGIGSGKSIISKVFQSLGVPILQADEVGKELLRVDPEVRSSVVKLLGSQAYQSNGEPDRKWIASRVFNNDELLKGLNAIIHPAVKAYTSDWLKRIAEQKVPYAIKEAAILFESGTSKQCDQIITVSAPEAVRVSRVMAREATDREAVLARMKKQWTDQQREEKSTHVILNDVEHAVLPAIMEIDLHLRS